MTNTFKTFFLIMIFSLNTFAVSSKDQNLAGVFVNKSSDEHQVLIKEFDETCLDEYMLRNKSIKKFIVWAPPVTVLSLPTYSYAYLLSVYALLNVAPFEALFYIGYGFYYISIPIAVGSFIALETMYSIEFFKNRGIIQILDALRLNDYNNKKVIKFIKKFRKKHPGSQISDQRIISSILELDNRGDLCNGNLTGNKSKKLRKLLAKKKHLFKYLKQLQ